MGIKKQYFILFGIMFLCAATTKVNAQCGPPAASNCQAVPASNMFISGNTNLDFIFDSFSKYSSGITISGATQLRLTVLPNNASCKWKLRVYIDNNPSAPTPVNEWETLTNYGGTGNIPQIDLMEVRIYNGCNTPINSGIYQNFTPLNGSYIDIINDIVLNPAGSCVTNVNGAGSYLTNYKEYSFTIDYRLQPGLLYKAGAYQLTLRFCLVEDV
ncbi:MAG: hypothetical protein K1X81_10805 [Bacteroidia bacterium]|nr:hypothetical protein [Bacteroidia bacterium]